MKNKIKIAFIGCGHMARAMIDGMTNQAAKAVLAANGDVFEIIAADRNESKLMPLKPVCAVTLDNALAVKQSDYVVLSVQPQCAREAVMPLELGGKAVISVMAGIDIVTLKEMTHSEKIVRVMPNINARVGEAYSVYASCGLDDRDRHAVESVLGSIGRFAEFDEKMLPAATGITGCGPAFMFVTLKALFDEAVSLGFGRDAAMEMAVQTALGSALAAEKAFAGGESLDALIAEVCTAGGATAAGVAALNDGGYFDALIKAVRASNARAAELKA